jgi:hypothetical protein
MKRNLSSLGYGSALAVFAFLAVASGGKTETKGDKGTTTTSGDTTAAATPSSAATVFETIELSRPSSEEIKFKIDVPVGTQIKTSGSRITLTKGDKFVLDIEANKQTIAEVKATMAGSDSGWNDVKIVKDTPNVVAFKGSFIGKTRTRIHSSTSIKGFWITCSNPTTAMVEGSAIDDMIKSCESFAEKAGAAAPVAAADKKPAAAAAAPKGAKTAPKKP